MKFIEGGVTAPAGFKAAGLRCGIRKNSDKKDLALIAADEPCAAAAVYTSNKVKGAPLTVTREHLQNGTARAVIANSGNANTCNADGPEKARRMCAAVARELSCDAGDVLVASTGVIGQPINIRVIESGIAPLCAALSADGSGDAADAILTTDLVRKECAAEFELAGKTARIGAMAKGSGMININMATMLCFITTDADISAPMLQEALSSAVKRTLNRVSVDGDTSTNDMAVILASGKAGGESITAPGPGLSAFERALEAVLLQISRMIARDGEGATKLLECRVSGADSEDTAVTLAKSVIMSSLVKSAMFGEDANWGRVLCALGYAGAPFDEQRCDMTFRSGAGEVLVCRGGMSQPFSEELAKKVLGSDEIIIDVVVGGGDGAGFALGCDLTYDYVKINGDYRT